MKKNLFPILIFLCQFWAEAQTVTISEAISTKEDAAYEIIADPLGNVLLFRNQNTEFQVQGFDNLMQKKWEKEIELDRKRPQIIKVVPMGGDFCVLYTFMRKSNLILKAHRYSPAANLVDSITVADLGSRLFAPNFSVIVSEDKKIAFIYAVEKDREVTGISFDMGKMKPLWNTLIAPEDISFYTDFLDMVVDNEGNMHLVFSLEKRKSKQDEHRLDVLEYGPATGEILRRYRVSMQGKLTFDAKFAFDNLNHCLVAGGFYSEDNIARAEGCFYLKVLQANPEEQVLKFHPFDDDFVRVLLEKEKSKNKGIADVSVQQIVLRKDAGIILIGELNKSFQRGGGSPASYGRMNMRPIIDYYYDDLFLVSLHPDGERHWKNILHKKQYSQDDDAIYSSYFLAKTPAALRVIFNDEIKQENTVSEYVISGNGESDRNAVMNTERKELSLRFRDAVQVTANEIIVPSERRGRLRLVKVRY